MSNIGINIWTVGDALKNPELGGAVAIQKDTMPFSVGKLHVAGGDTEFGQAEMQFGVSVSSNDAEARAELQFDVSVIGADYEYGQAVLDFDVFDVVGGGEAAPNIQGGHIALRGVAVEGVGYTWKSGEAELEFPLHIYGGDEENVGQAELSFGVEVSGGGNTQNLHGVVWIPGLAGFGNLVFAAEGLTASDAVDAQIAVIAKEIVSIAADLTTAGSWFQADVTEDLVAGAVLQVPYLVQIVESLEAEDNQDIVAFRLVQVAEAITAGEDYETQATLQVAVALTLALRDSTDTALTLTVGEAIDVLATNSVNLRAAIETVEAIAAEAAHITNAIIAVDTAESASIAGELSTQATLQALVEEGAALYVNIRVGEDVINGWVLNTANLAFSEYTNFPFNSLAAANGRHFAVAEDGLYELTGEDDQGDPIEASLRTGLLSLGSHYIKDAKAAYIGYTSSGKLVLKVATTAKGQKEEWWYELKQDSAESLRDGRVTIGRGLRAKYWQFEVTNVDGADFELDDIQVMYNILSRRIR